MADSSNKDTYVQPAIPKFDGFYEHWAKLMENFLRSKEYWNMIEEGIPAAPQGREPTAAESKVIVDHQLKDKKVKNYLYQAIDREIMETILNDETSKEIWDSMKQKYKGSTRVKRAQLQGLKTEFEMLRMKEGETSNAYFGRVLSVAKRMKTYGEAIKESDITGKIMRSLVPRFNYVVCSIEESSNTDTLTVDELQSSLLIHEQRMKGLGQVDEEQVLKVSAEERWERGRGRAMLRGRGRGRGRQQFNKALVECYRCHNLGHFQYECPKGEKQAHYAEFNDPEEMLLMAHTDLSQRKKEGVWFLDSGCSNHMTGKKEWFVHLDETFRHSVKLGNDTKMDVMGKGNIVIEIKGQTQTVTDVFFIPELCNNLLSMGQLLGRGITILMTNGVCKLYHPRRGCIIESVMTANRMFTVDTNILTNESACFNANTTEVSELWHRRFGHLSYKNLTLLCNKDMVSGMPTFKSSAKVCIGCMVGKQNRAPFSRKSTWRAARHLQLVHSDLCGPISPESHGNKRYILTFTDDFSRKVWVYFLREKGETFGIFKIFKIMVEKESGLQICSLRTDRGGEFNSKEFSEFCTTHGIKRQLTTSYSPQQNGVAERKNRTILNMVRCLLEEKKMPKAFWPEAAKWTCHIINRSPTSAVKDKTPEECWSGLKPNVEYFRVFGCLGNVHVPEENRSKLDARSQKRVMIGYSEESKGYKMINPLDMKVTISRDVVFEEEECWDWQKTASKTVNVTLDWGDVYDEDDENDTDTENDEEERTEEGAGSSSTEEATSPVLPVSDRRERRIPAYLRDYTSGEEFSEEEVQHFLMFMSTDPICYEDAAKSRKWRDAMDLEIAAIEKNHTWQLVQPPHGAKVIGVKWVYRTKMNENGEVHKCKARLVAKGYAQEKGINFNEVFAPVARWDTIRMVIALAARNGWKLHQLDVKSAFLHGNLDEVVYVAQPPGYEVKGEESKV